MQLLQSGSPGSLTSAARVARKRLYGTFWPCTAPTYELCRAVSLTSVRFRSWPWLWSSRAPRCAC